MAPAASSNRAIPISDRELSRHLCVLAPVNSPIDGARFEAEVAASLDHLYGTALRLAKNRANAEDLVAEAVSKAWIARESLKDPAQFQGWIIRILTNTFISECRKRGTISLDETDGDSDEFSLFEHLHQPFLLWWSNPEQEFLRKVLREDLTRAFDGLPEVFRVVVVLSELEGFSYQEIADTLGVPIGTVRSRLARGRSLLQQALWQHSDAGRVSAANSRAGGER
jgi:RNA polymerase sigma-70 factor (ECF subfamily)